jgi:AcrR family transcriptional regulator
MESQPDSTIEFKNEITDVPSASKQAILDAAQNLLAVHGYAGLSMRELASESGLAKATIYHHFHDKRDVFLNVLERDMQTVHSLITAAAAVEHEPIGRLSAVIRTYFGLMHERRTVIMHVLRELGEEEEKLRDFLCHKRGQYFSQLVLILQQGIAEGVFRPLNPEFTAISMVGMINAFIVFRNLVAEDTNKVSQAEDEIVDHTLQLLLHGVVKA